MNRAAKGNRSGHVGEEAVKRYLFIHFRRRRKLTKGLVIWKTALKRPYSRSVSFRKTLARFLFLQRKTKMKLMNR